MAEGNGQPLEPWPEQLVVEIRAIHEEILKTGGAAGEHTARLLATVGRPFQSAFGKSIYPTDLQRAAALFHGIIVNHPFADGNKRTATIAALYLLFVRGQLHSDPAPVHLRLLGEVAIETASGRLDVEDVILWFIRILSDLID